MTKKIFLAFAFSILLSSFANAQVTHAQWKQSIKKINDCEYDLIFTVTLDKGYHIPSVTKIKDAEGEVFPTAFNFNPNKDYTLVGNVVETKPTSEYDETIKKTVFLHYNIVTFTQRIKLNSAGNLKVNGTYEYQICNSIGCNFPPKDSFNFDLKGTAVCKK